ncbi:NAD(P)-binding protein [Microbacterium sp. H1-D42]|uniref:NAD(P)-binding protein n=1 Tax=Microbacterium sp. H1-D42 TaxID=2925844 RepID=UPI001F538C22|nr:NAD(P)-binding protein [Microbacterium sp. H1-D42]UNK69995.1 NAD(P)-binding protein [Microbacterium sp. H1-D42]
MTKLEFDYLVVGAGAMGMAFTDALIDHAPGARVALVDRRHGVGGHWLEAYPFVRLHQASALYGVGSTLLGGGRTQHRGSEVGLQERATKSEICSYFERVLDRLRDTDRVEFFSGCEYPGLGRGDRRFASRVSGAEYSVPDGCVVVDAHYLAPRIPAEVPPPFEVAEGARVLPVGELVHLAEPAGEYVIAGSGKTATDACVWLLTHGVAPDAITWVRPRDPWMTNRAVVQPVPEVFLGMLADIVTAAEHSHSVDELFFALEDAGVMLRIDPKVTPTMARAPTLAEWELDLLRTIEHIVRRGHIRRVERRRVEFDDGSLAVGDDALVIHCAAEGLLSRPLVPIWSPGEITLQPVRAGFPCFGAAITGYVEATRGAGSSGEDDESKNELCRPSPYPDTLAAWVRMIAVGGRNAAVFGAVPDIAEWASTVAINPARIDPNAAHSADLDAALARVAAHAPAGMARLIELGAAAA